MIYDGCSSNEKYVSQCGAGKWVMSRPRPYLHTCAALSNLWVLGDNFIYFANFCLKNLGVIQQVERHFFVFPGHSLLRNFQLRLVCHDVCVMRLLRTKRRDSPSGRVQTGGHDDPTFVTNAKKTHGAFRHRRRRRGRSLIPTPNYATHTTLRARESIGALLMVLSANIVHMKRVP